MGDQRIDRNRDAARKAQEERINNMPMNKNFFQAKNEDGSLKYPIAEEIFKYKISMNAENEDLMRQISAYISQIRHHENRIKRIKEQIEGEVVERDSNGRLFTREELQLLLMSEKIAIPRDVDSIRIHLFDKMLPRIDEITFTAELYNEYVLLIKATLEKMGYELMPKEIKLIVPEL